MIYRNKILQVTMIMFALIGLSISGFTQEIVIDNFDSYNAGTDITTQSSWYSTGDHQVVFDYGAPFGNTLKSISSVNAQGLNLDYSFPFTTSSLTYVKFQGRITSGSGNNSQSRIYLLDNNDNYFFFGINHTPSLSLNYQTCLFSSFNSYPSEVINGTSLTADTWYDFMLEIDWSYQAADNTYGLATLKYKETTSNIWITETVAENIELHMPDPTAFVKIYARMDGLSDRRGEMDNIIYSNQSIYSVQTDASYGQLDSSVEIPAISTSTLTVDDAIYSYQFNYAFDDTKLAYTGYDLAGLISEGGTVEVNTDTPGQLAISWMRATPLVGTGDLIHLQFNAIAEGTSDLTITNFKYNETNVTDVTNGDITIVTQTTADITYSTDVILPGTELVITATFNNLLNDSPIAQISLNGANTLSATDMTKVSETVYTFTHTVTAGEGIVNVSLSTGIDEFGFAIENTPLSGATFEILALTYGDVSDNGEVTAYDAALALMYSVGVDPMPAIASLPWDLWRVLTADVDGVNDVTATDAGLILQYSVGFISIFPVEDGAKSGESKDGDIIVEVIDNEFVFTTQDELVGFNLFVTNNSNVILGEPEFLDQNMLSATQIEGEIYNLGTCIAISPASGTQIF